MRQELNKKVFRALGPHVVEKRFIGTEEAIPEGWHADQSAAMSAYQEPSHAVQQEQEAPAQEVKRRGRPRKVAE